MFCFFLVKQNPQHFSVQQIYQRGMKGSQIYLFSITFLRLPGLSTSAFTSQLVRNPLMSSLEAVHSIKGNNVCLFFSFVVCFNKCTHFNLLLEMKAQVYHKHLDKHFLCSACEIVDVFNWAFTRVGRVALIMGSHSHQLLKECWSVT